ncbi:MFS transporter [Muribacter muris]|uniref:MFS transporter n=1 Tax=Muribacter muris TaxID=67855 RepID=A0A4Y9JT79_9PAST|nr:MFS transporter [Muribacter muris]MBF0785701.1 MFS transporter [Muribacter muris]MBF0827736.1 MFS transporter [Muribacter muris]TFV08778.1 MFS transporter [Muribacter muris]
MQLQTPQAYYLSNRNYWIFSGYFFVYFFIMATCYPFLGIWLGDINGLSGEERGIVFASMSFFALCFQPIFGYVADKLGIKKHLLWVVAITLLFYSPFFIYVFAPLLQTNIWLGAIAGGIYMGFVFSGGAPASEAYVERVSRRSHFEYGRARMFGMFGWAICASLAGIMYAHNPNSVFWLGSAGAVVLLVLVALAKPEQNASTSVAAQLGANKNPVTLKQAFLLLKLPRFWALLAYVIGVACIYDIFDQQFGNFFNTFFESKEQGMEMFGYVTTGGELLNALIMFFVPLLINRIGAKNALLIAGMIMSIRIIGSSYATTAWHVVVLKTLHMFEVPFYLVGLFKYIANVFEVHFSATIYLVACQFAKQVANMLMSATVGTWYDKFGFQETYFILGCIALAFTLLSVFTLTGKMSATERYLLQKRNAHGI